MIFENSPVEWKAPPKSIAAPFLLVVRFAWILLLTFALIIPFIAVRYGQLIFGGRHGEYAVFRLWGRLSWYGFAIRPRIHGTPMKGGGAIVANHQSWLDIPLLFGAIGGYMVAKTQVRSYALVGQFAWILGTEFVDRKRASSKEQANRLAKRMAHGDRIVFFPEGTSTDGLQVLPFRSTLFAALVETLPDGFVQPVSIVFHSPKGASRNFFGWWDDMSLLQSAGAVLTMVRRADVDVVFHDPIKIGTDRKALARKAQATVEVGFKEYQS